MSVMTNYSRRRNCEHMACKKLWDALGFSCSKEGVLDLNNRGGSVWRSMSGQLQDFGQPVAGCHKSS